MSFTLIINAVTSQENHAKNNYNKIPQTQYQSLAHPAMYCKF